VGLGNFENVGEFFTDKIDIQKQFNFKIQEDVIDELPFSELVIWNWSQTSS
jgi:hypothetical protein